jgi:hypothetical protein
MIALKLKSQRATAAILDVLDKKNLIKTLKASGKVLASQAKNGAMETIYCSHRSWGAHKLICVKKNSIIARLNSGRFVSLWAF